MKSKDWFNAICVDNGRLKNYKDLTENKRYLIKFHSNVNFITVRMDDDGGMCVTYPKNLFNFVNKY